MLINFKISNFLSFKEETTFTFSSNNKDCTKTIPYGKYNINKTNVIYGANASGKSNILRAILFMKNMIIFSHDQNRKPGTLGYKKYLLSNEDANSTFEISFIMNNETYNYSFSINPLTEEIINETLILYTSQKPTKLYTRNGMFIKTSANKKFIEADERKQYIRPNGLALSIFSNIGGELSMKIREFFITKIHIFGLLDGNNPFDTFDMIEKYGDKFKIFLKELLISADLNVSEMEYSSEPKMVYELPPEQVQFLINTPGFDPSNRINIIQSGFIHNVYNDKLEVIDKVKFSPEQESTGTNRLANLSGSLFNVMMNGMTLFIDELDSSLHPHIVREIVKYFNSSDNVGSQLVFSSHDISLLDEPILNYDQIWFTNKNKYGSSSISCLADFKGLSSIKSIQKAYTQGRFEGIANIDSFKF